MLYIAAKMSDGFFTHFPTNHTSRWLELDQRDIQEVCLTKESQHLDRFDQYEGVRFDACEGCQGFVLIKKIVADFFGNCAHLVGIGKIIHNKTVILYYNSDLQGIESEQRELGTCSNTIVRIGTQSIYIDDRARFEG